MVIFQETGDSVVIVIVELKFWEQSPRQRVAGDVDRWLILSATVRVPSRPLVRSYLRLISIHLKHFLKNYLPSRCTSRLMIGRRADWTWTTRPVRKYWPFLPATGRSLSSSRNVENSTCAGTKHYSCHAINVLFRPPKCFPWTKAIYAEPEFTGSLELNNCGRIRSTSVTESFTKQPRGKFGSWKWQHSS